MRKLVFGLILAFGVSLFPAGAHADTVSDEASFVAKINDLRASKGLPALQVNANLVSKARGWAAGMAAAGRIWHSTLSDGITADWQKLGENVGMGGSVDGLHAAFVASPHHYENLVDPVFNYVGIGVVDSGGKIYVTVDFMQLNNTPATAAPAPVQRVQRPRTTTPPRPAPVPQPVPVTAPPAPAPPPPPPPDAEAQPLAPTPALILALEQVRAADS